MSQTKFQLQLKGIFLLDINFKLILINFFLNSVQ